MSEPKMTTRKVPNSAARFSFGEAAFAKDGDEGKFTLVPYNGQVFSHAWWGNMAFDVGGITMRKNVIPAFKDHDPSQLVGEIDSMTKDGNKVSLSGEFIESEASTSIRSTKKLEWECSLAFALDSAVVEEVGNDATVEVNGQKLSGPGVVFRKAELFETSFTFFGAVPGTKTAFAKDDGETEITVFSTLTEENPMSDKKELDMSREEGLAQGRNLFSSMNALCEDKAFVAECFSKEMSLEAFQVELLKKLQAEKDALLLSKNELQEKLDAKLAAPAPVAGQAPVQLNHSESDAPPAKPEAETFHSAAKALAKEMGISFSKACSITARQKPELYSASNPAHAAYLAAIANA